ncbi:MAG: phosphatase PAP2 family protein [Bacteroidota bacterium]
MIEYLAHLDREWFIAINTGMQHSFWDVVCPFMRHQKNWYVLYGLILLVCYKIWGTKTGWILLGATMLILVSDQVSANLIKNTVQRLRPCNEPSLAGMVRTLAGCGKGYSFISAHATNHFAIAVFFSILFSNRFKWIWFVAVPWAALIAFSQVYVGVHYPLDVLCGALLGSLLGYLAGFIINKKILTPHV